MLSAIRAPCAEKNVDFEVLAEVFELLDALVVDLVLLIAFQEPALVW